MFMHAFWILILVIGLFLLVRWLAGTSAGRQVHALLPATSSLEILKQRYAKGEIEREEFEQMKRDLEAI